MIKTCLMCGNEMIATRSSRKFCSDNCKLKYNRLPQSARDAGLSIRAKLDELHELSQKYPHLATLILDEISVSGQSLANTFKAIKKSSNHNLILPTID